MTTLKQRVGSMLVVGFDGKVVDRHIKHMIHQYRVGGIILFGRNIGTPKEVLRLTTDLQLEAEKAGYNTPLLICIDQENGVVRRLGEGTTRFPGSMLIGATQNPMNAYHVGKATGEELRALGINWNLAPSVDVNSNPKNPVIGVRSYGESADMVSAFSKENIRGMKEAGILSTIKHFPGHGDTEADSHLGLPVVPHTKSRLMNVELKPFIDCIEAGADAVMSAHIHLPSIQIEEGRPATLSKSIITGLLRDELGFEGVVTTDCMEMDAISKGIGTPQGGVEAIKAGVDLVMVSHTQGIQEETIEAIVEAVKKGEITEGRVEESMKRIQKLKESSLSWNQIETSIDVPSVVGCNEHRELAQRVFDEGVTLVHDIGILPLSQEHTVLVVYPQTSLLTQAEDPAGNSTKLGDTAQSYSANVDVMQLNEPINAIDVSNVLKQAGDYDVVIVGTVSAKLESFQVELINKLKEAKSPVIVVSTRNPYDVMRLSEVDAYITTYENTSAALETAVAGIYGETTLKGKLPVTLKSL
ncbi:glycoside hydrolase family 3 protein [Pontibacillus marinus]|uniref:glycoside hydrolase family 3 protein n=1 Tax=Pontibacillus marinus TaxID=273164 RepID=UPI00041DF5A2|nr:glycoside hydrolase family 3 protein [Pontibacillus marinus]